MKILQVNYTDVLGSRFNGGALNEWLRSLGHDGMQAVAVKTSKENISVNLSPQGRDWIGSKVLEFAKYVEARTGIHNVAYPQSFLLPFNPEFRSADLVHYHIVHNQFFSYLALPWLTKLKPTVWSLHDPWALTGHCIHPFDCEGWLRGCNPCPHLDYAFAIPRDIAWLNYRLKGLAYGHSKFRLIVASRWMLDKVQRSPLMKGVQVTQIPFGLDLNVFSPADKAECKKRLGIPSDKVVLGLRAVVGPFKGLQYILKALDNLPASTPIHVLTCQDTDQFKSITKKFSVTELGQIDSDFGMVEFFGATDIHLMPSVAESFGMMAMESAACGVPSIVFSGTSLSEISFSPDGGVVVERGNQEEFDRALLSLIHNDVLREEMGRKAREHAVGKYSFQKYVDAHLMVYREALESFNGRP